MKKLIVFLILFVDISMLVIYFNMCMVYDNDINVLNSLLGDVSYEEYINGLKLDKDNYIDSIEKSIGYSLDSFDNFEEIKEKMDNEYDELNVINMDLDNKKIALTKQRNTLSNRYNEILAEEKKKSTYIISNVPKINQYSLGYPTGCESAALTNLLNYWGISVNIGEVVSVLPKGSLPYYENGVKYGGNPYLEFVGNPNSYSSYGVYEKPIIGVANKFKSGIIDGIGMSLNEVLEIVKEDRPVIVWVSMNMAVPYISTSWIYRPTGEKISWMANEHALVVVGYNQEQVIVTDSLNGKIRYYDKKVFESRYKTYGKRALYY